MKSELLHEKHPNSSMRLEKHYFRKQRRWSSDVVKGSIIGRVDIQTTEVLIKQNNDQVKLRCLLHDYVADIFKIVCMS